MQSCCIEFSGSNIPEISVLNLPARKNNLLNQMFRNVCNPFSKKGKSSVCVCVCVCLCVCVCVCVCVSGVFSSSQRNLAKVMCLCGFGVCLYICAWTGV